MNELYETCRDNLDKLGKWYSNNKGDRNEATTRFHLIDELLLNCLGWERQNITTEEVYNREYTDYVFNITRPVLILEAKKEGIYFELPEGKKDLRYSLKSLCKDYKELKKAIEQVSGYCQARGIQIGAVSNGWQLVVFIAIRVDGIPPLEGNAYVFSSLEFMQEKFLEFWNIFSKYGLEKQNVRNKLLGEVIHKLPPKLSATLSTYPGIKNRNTDQTDMQIISDIVLEDVIKQRDIEKHFLKECYCKSGALSQYTLISKEILKNRYDYLFEKENQKANLNPVVNKKGLTSDFSDTVASNLSKRPILLIGDVGVGKSSFMNNLIKVEAENIFQNSITFIIDLGSQAVLSLDVRNAIIGEIYRQLLKDYGIDVEEDNFVRGTYNLELIRFRNGIHKSLFETNDQKAIEKEIEFLELKIKDKTEHLKNSLIHISKGRKKQIIIFIDNCDQRDDSTQQLAFLIAHEFAEHWPTIVFVSLRPETFHRSMKAGALSGYHPKAFTISPPRIDEVLGKRLNFAQKITRGDIPSTQIKADFKFSRLDTLIEILKNSFKDNKHLLEFIDNISYGNIRQAIDLVKGFLGSGHVDTGKILNIYKEPGQYTIPLHEFLRAVIFGDNIYYNPISSPITNLFDVHYYDKKEHFLLPILLYTLHAHLISGKNDGFLGTDTAYNHLQGLGFTVDQVDTVIKNAYTRKLLETSSRGDLINPENLPSMLRITTVGEYHICNLCNLFTYIDSIIVDTPIFDRDLREKIYDATNINERLIRAEIFKGYLDNVWNAFNNLNTLFDWKQKSNELKADIERVKERVHRRNY